MVVEVEVEIPIDKQAAFHNYSSSP